MRLWQLNENSFQLGHRCNTIYEPIYEPWHDQTNKVIVRLAKIQISLGICPVWSESSLCIQWVSKDPGFLHADSEDSDQTGRMHSHIVGFVMLRLMYIATFPYVPCLGTIFPNSKAPPPFPKYWNGILDVTQNPTTSYMYVWSEDLQ